MASWLDHCAVIDFETMPIQPRPEYPPRPVGVAIRLPGQTGRYYSWGHPTGNNCTEDDGRRALADVYDSRRPLLFHKAKFDLDVARECLGLSIPTWDRVYDTLPMLFLVDPRAPSYGLKPSAERLLGHAPDERDDVVDWLIEHQPVEGLRLTAAKRGGNYAGAYVAMAPGDLVGRYAIGDVDRTLDLARLVYPQIERRGMLGALDMERELMLHLLSMERRGVRVRLDRLAHDVPMYDRALVDVDEWIRGRVGVDDLNIDSGAALAKALVSAGLADESLLGRTKTGKMQTNKDALARGVVDQDVLRMLSYRAKIKTASSVFMTKWLDTAQRSGGRIYTEWHSTRSDHSGGGKGARTGRFSSTPNFQNLANEYSQIFGTEGCDDANLPTSPIPLPPLPNIRSYVIPFDGHVFIDRDYSQQEPRILAHYEDGELCAEYQREPWTDMHEFVRRLVSGSLRRDVTRKQAKAVGLGLMYGLGVGKLAVQMGTDVETARAIREAVLNRLPGLRDIGRVMRHRARSGQPIRTWGGREYFCEPPKVVGSKIRTYEYKLINVLIQGSGADCIKRALLNYFRAKPADHHVCLIPHDEVLASVPADQRDDGMLVLRRAMEDVQFDVPMLTEGKWSDTDWGSLQTYDERGATYAG